MTLSQSLRIFGDDVVRRPLMMSKPLLEREVLTSIMDNCGIAVERLRKS
jgi:hypothetical protein